jgi:hypothetical protein
MGASICCAEAEADTQFAIFAWLTIKKQCLIFQIGKPMRFQIKQKGHPVSPKDGFLDERS